MAGEVTAAGAAAQPVRARSADIEQSQTPREATQPSRNEGVEVRISPEAPQRAENADLTYENLRPRGGAAPEADIQANAETERAQEAERVAVEEAAARRAARRESTDEARQTGL